MAASLHTSLPIGKWAAIEFGSGVIRYSEADVKDKEITFMEEISVDHNLAEKAKSKQSILGAVDEAISLLFTQLITKAKEQGVQKISIAATEIFRSAQDGKKYIRSLSDHIKHHSGTIGISIKIISIEEEGKLGYLAIKSSIPTTLSSLSSSIVVWDAGTGSTQMTLFKDGMYHVYKTNGFKRVCDVVNEKNPGSKGDAEDIIANFIKPPSDDQKETFELIRFFPEKMVFRRYSTALEKFFGKDLSELTVDQMNTEMDQYYQKTSGERDLKIISSIIANLVIMRMFDVPRVPLIKAGIGNTRGLFLEPSLWDGMSDF